VLEELLKIAKDYNQDKQKAVDSGLSKEEIAFYDALAANGSAKELMLEPELRFIAQELLNNIRSNTTVDWMHRESARARLRVLVKGILKKYGYPPDLQDSAVQTVLEQAEALAKEIASGQ
jgi:type I restriction enzyme R subunit